MVTDDPETPGSNKWEINLAVLTEINSNEAHLEAPLMDINYGLGERIQLKYEVPWVVSTQNGQQSQSSIDRSVAGVKWRFLDNDQYGLKVSTYPQLTFPTPGHKTVVAQESGATEETEGSETSRPDPAQTRDLLLPLEFQKRFGQFGVNQELGYTFSGVGPNLWNFGVVANYSLTEETTFLCELHGSKRASESGGTELITNVGGQIGVSERFGILVSVGRTLRSFDDESAHFLTYGGVQVHL